MKNLSPNEETIENGQQKVEWKKEMKKKKKKERKKEHGGGRVKVLWGNKNNFFFFEHAISGKSGAIDLHVVMPFHS